MKRFAIPALVIFAVGLALPLAPLAAQDGDDAQPDERPQQGGNLTIQPAQPTNQAIPVPDGEVVQRQELEGGLIVEDIRIGEGYEVKPGGAVVAHYHGTLREDGKVFDSSFQRGQPVPFSLGGVIEGWQKGVPGMRVGGVRRLTIPWQLAYGEVGRPPTIPSKADLVFVIELVDALQIEVLEEGDGEAARTPFVAVTVHTIKDEDGNVVQKVEREDPYLWIPEEFPGMQFGLEGMKVGGKRRLKVPAQMNSAHPALPTDRPTNVPLEIEVEMIAKRNLPRG